jgi:hypothetical protein
LARVHPALAPLCKAGAGYILDLSIASRWFALPTGRGFAGYGLARALRMLLDVLAGLTALHETETDDGVGFVHGELGPALVRVDTQGVARLVPLAPWHWQTAEAPLSAQSLGYLAPERLLGDAIDRRADVFSAGVLLWEALAGSRLFERDSVDQIIVRLMGGKVTLPELPPELAWAVPLKAVAMRALSVDPAQRFLDCPALAAAIELAARGRVASHAQVAVHFNVPARAQRALLPPLPRPPSGQGFHSPHKSSLSALVAPSLPALPASAELSVPAPSVRERGRRGAWMVTALVSLFVALGVVAFTRHNRPEVVPHAASPAASPSAPERVPSASAVPVAPSAPTAAESSVAPEVPRQAPDRAPHPARPAASPRDAKGRAAPKLTKPPAPGKPRPSDSEAEQYGI